MWGLILSRRCWLMPVIARPTSTMVARGLVLSVDAVVDLSDAFFGHGPDC